MRQYILQTMNYMNRIGFLLAFLFVAHLTSAQVIISGQISKANNENLENVPVYLGGDIEDATLTGADGTYQFTVPAQGNYTVTPYHNGNILNGVSTYDLILMGLLLGDSISFETPYQYIAADIDRSGGVDLQDTLLLRSALLFGIDEFPNNTSWRFIDAAFVFPNPSDPFATAFPDSVVINNLTEDLSNVDFVGVKIGDVSQSGVCVLSVNPCDISCGHIIGNVFHDLNENCLLESSESGLKYWQVKVEGDYTAYGTTNELGDYSIPIFPGEYTVSLIPYNELWEACQISHLVTIEMDGEEVVNFPVKSLVDCPAMVVDIGTPFLRRCFPSKYYVEYCNQGTVTASDASVEVCLDTFLTFLGSSIPHTALGGNVYSFEVGDLEINECGNFIIDVEVSCESVLGQTHCTSAKVFPDSICLPPSVNWDGSDIEVSSTCSEDSLYFEIKNWGDPMTQSVDFIVIEDDMIMRSDDIQLGANDLIALAFPANGSTWRMEVDQSANHPSNIRLSEAVEGCGLNGEGTFSTGFITQFFQFTSSSSEDIDCTENIGAYDPNDKSAIPVGFGEEHLIRENTDLEYKIRFQNTGTDTAFNIVIKDTLSDVLNIESVRPLTSSHPYSFKILGENVIQFSFNNIMLPDSNVNQAASNGFVKFEVAQNLDLPLGTIIENNAAIYFDFNAPIITNTVKHVVGQYFVNITSHSVDRDNPKFEIKVIPNPFSESAILQLEGIHLEQGEFELYNSMGQLMKQQSISGNSFELFREDLSQGLYLFSIKEKGRLLSHGKLMIH